MDYAMNQTGKNKVAPINFRNNPADGAASASRRGAWWLLVAVLALSLTGCVWLRPLTFKNQLKNFDKYVTVRDTNGLSLYFTKPVLVQSDIQYLLNAAPTSALTNGSQVAWLWTFEKVQPSNAAPAKPLDLTFSTLFVSNKLDSIRCAAAALVHHSQTMALEPVPLPGKGPH